MAAIDAASNPTVDQLLQLRLTVITNIPTVVALGEQMRTIEYEVEL